MAIEAARVVIRSYTASFRVPYFQGHQLSLRVPPISTVLGLISAAAGKWILPKRDISWLGYCFSYQARGEDVETIISYEDGAPKYKGGKLVRNVFNREFLYKCELVLYLPRGLEVYFYKPRYPLLLGRSQDLAYVFEIKNAVLKPNATGVIKGVLLPHEYVYRWGIVTVIHNLPIAFDEKHDYYVKPGIFGIVDKEIEVKEPNDLLHSDEETGKIIPVFYFEKMLKQE